MKYDPAMIQQVSQANDIVEVISEYVPLKRSGKNYKGCSPFTNEKTPSFFVSPDKQLFHCFSSSTGGDLFSFLMKVENLSFPEALKRMADRANIKLPENQFSSKNATRNEKLYEMYEAACDFYQKKLFSRDGRSAREYLKSRGFTEEWVRLFKIGWAPDDWRELLNYLKKLGFDEKLMAEAALVKQSQKGTVYDVFRGRVLFPILNAQDKPIAFGGRLIGEGEGPKYLNSPEHPVFKKRSELYGLNFSRKHIDSARPRLILVEGYMDFASLYMEGFKNVVATLGTALSESHVKVLKRFSDEVIVLYDGDRAGIQAALRGLEILLEGGVQVRLVTLPEGMDPDDFLKSKGRDAFQKLIDEAVDFFDFKMNYLKTVFPDDDGLAIVKITNEFLDTFLKVTNQVLLSNYFKRLSEELLVDENSLRDEFKKLKEKSTSQKNYVRPEEIDGDREESEEGVKKNYSGEELLVLSLLVQDRELSQKYLDRLKPEHFRHEESRVFLETLKKNVEFGNRPTVSVLLSSVEERAFKDQVFNTISFLEVNESEEKEEMFLGACRKMKKVNQEKKLESLRKMLLDAEKRGDQAQAAQYLQEYQVLLKASKGNQ